MVEGCLVGGFEVGSTGDGLEHGQVTGFRFVKAGQETVNHAHAAFGSDHQLGPGVGGDNLAVTFVGGAFERADNRCSDGDHPPAVGFRGADSSGGELRHPVFLRVRLLVALQAGYARVERERDELNTLVGQTLQHVRAEGATSRRHFRRARRPRVNRLIHLDRPLAAHIRIRDWLPVTLQQRRYVDVESGQPEPARTGVRHQ